MPEDEVTAANREQRRAAKNGKGPHLVRVVEAPFEPRVIGVTTLAELRQIKTRTEVIEDALRRQRLLGYEVQLLQLEAATFVTNVSNAHGNPPGGQCTVDSESGEITLTSVAPQPEPDEVPGGIDGPDLPTMDASAPVQE